IVAPVVKLVPIRVTPPADPVTPAEGLTALSVGGGAVTVNATAALVPPVVLTVTFELPRAALAATVNVAVIWLEFTTLTALTVTPALLTATVAPEMKFAPESVTATLLPCCPAVGAIEVSTGAGG